MALLFADSTNHYTTAQIAQKYDTASMVTVVPGAGRLSGQAIFCDATANAQLVKALAPHDLTHGGELFTCGFAFKPVVLTSSPNPPWLLTLPLSNGTSLVLTCTGTGQLQILKVVTGGIVGSVVAVSPPNTVRLNVGCYIEVQFNLNDALHATGRAAIHVNGVSVLTAVFPSQVGATYSSVTLAKGPDGFSFGGKFYVADIYMLDGNTDFPVGGIRRLDGTVATLGTFLGNISVQAIVASNNGLNLYESNTPWVPALGGTDNVSNVRAQFAADNPSVGFNGGYPTGNLDSFQMSSPRAGAIIGTDFYGFTAGQPWPLYAVQAVARVKSGGAAPQFKPLVRRIVGGTIPTDLVVEGALRTVTDVDYYFELQPYQADPTNGNKAWDIRQVILNPHSASDVQDVEFGLHKVIGES